MGSLCLGLFQAAMSACNAAVVVVCSGQVVVMSARAQALLLGQTAARECSDLALPEPIRDVAARVVTEGCVQETKLSIAATGSVLKVVGTPYTGAHDGRVYAILALEQGLRPYDMVLDMKVARDTYQTNIL